MATALGSFFRNAPSPLLFMVAGYIALRSLEIALRPQEGFRTRFAQAVMTVSATGLFLVAILFMLGEILRAIGLIALPWPAGSLARL